MLTITLAGLHLGARHEPQLHILAGSIAKGAQDFLCSHTHHLSCELRLLIKKSIDIFR